MGEGCSHYSKFGGPHIQPSEQAGFFNTACQYRIWQLTLLWWLSGDVAPFGRGRPKKGSLPRVPTRNSYTCSVCKKKFSQKGTSTLKAQYVHYWLHSDSISYVPLFLHSFVLTWEIIAIENCKLQYYLFLSRNLWHRFYIASVQRVPVSPSVNVTANTVSILKIRRCCKRPIRYASR